jgi:glutathione synthase/RimK-type ligase-like ATP-grasp enzyme
MSDNFFPSLLQHSIPKLYELRIFYLGGDFYSMAIFSQEDEQTKTDFRNYNYQKPNRTVPYKLPQEIEDKLDKFMKEMDLDTGSIDMIVTPRYEYVFLEVNPVGQYEMTSIPCNYYLNEKIAKYLTDEY